ncbi:MAG: hypothetical protein Q7S62_00835 [bacterium]|nr:hypothetical protein [bacterium]
MVLDKSLSLDGQMERLEKLIALARDAQFTSLVLKEVQERVKDLPSCEVPWGDMELRLQGMIPRILWAIGIAETMTLVFRDSWGPGVPWLNDLRTTRALSRSERWAAAACALSLPEIQGRIQGGAIPREYMLVAVETFRQHVTGLGKEIYGT